VLRFRPTRLFAQRPEIADLEGSTGLKVIHEKHPEVFIPSGIMERGNFSAAAGFGFEADKFGVFSTFSAFLEMVISEITMARLNNCNVLSHFSHSGGRSSDPVLLRY
jgi:transketolase C-terminal domain/subunit